jgi:CheY-like chemotaxis protein
LLADDASILRKTVKQLLDGTKNKTFRRSGFQLALSMVVALKPNVILLDLHMPDDYEFKPAFVKSELSRCGSRVLAMSFSGSKLLAEAFGAVAMLDKANLHEILIPEILGQRQPNTALEEVCLASN